ncbi:MAG TPA: hypothetical protein VLF09_12225 [Cellvibrio sp.]|nr:hypothetical protein [Cellvibrio sp.]
MANTNKTKAEILQELESIKGLLLEEDDIPILQDMEDEDEILDDELHSEPPVLITRHESVLPGQASLFDEPKSAAAKIAQQLNASTSTAQELKRTGFAAPQSNTPINPFADNRPLAKASGENPFLPQHIRERLHGNNPPPLFEYETAKKIISSTKNIAHKTNKPRQYLVEEVMLSMMPQIERELRHRLFSMSVEDLEKLLNEEED